MRYFYELFKDEIQNHPQVVDELICLPWGHIRYIIDNCKNDSHKAPQDFQSTLPSIEQIEKELSKQVKLATHK